MAKFYGAIGFGMLTEDDSGIWSDEITEIMYSGELIRNNRRLQSSDKLNDDINISNQISIVADPFVQSNFHSIKYVEFMGTKWKVTDVDVQYPRLNLSLGGVYNAK